MKRATAESTRHAEVVPDDVFDLPGVDELYGLDLAEFVAARDALAKRIRADGDREGAAAVKRLAKPSVVAWAVNRVARDRRDDVAELVAVGEEMREHQAAAVRGDDPAPLREATARRRTLLKDLAGAAVALAGPAHADEVRTTLEAASLDDGSTSLRHGRLTKTAEAAGGFGFGGFELGDDGAEPDAAPPSAGRRPKPSPSSGGTDAGRADPVASPPSARRRTESSGTPKEADAEREEAQRAEAERERAALAAEVSRLTEELAGAEEVVAAAVERVRAAAAALAAEEDALDAARRAADDARTALEVARTSGER